MSDKDKLRQVQDAFNWCIHNEKECADTKYETDSKIDNWDKLKRVLDEVFK